MTNDERKAVERKVVRKLIRMLKAGGWHAVEVDDGGDNNIPVITETETMDAIFAVDEARVYFTNGKRRHTVLIVLGNEYDVIADHSMNDGDDFAKLMDEHMEYVDRLQEA